jgi:hypothetical protein
MIIALHPARRHPQRLLAVLAILTVTAVLLGALVPPLTALALLGLLAANLGDFLLPTRYRFSETDVEIRRGPWSHSYPWSRFSSYLLDRNGILLSTFAVRHPLESFRGQFLALNREERAAVAEWLSGRLVQLG